VSSDYLFKLVGSDKAKNRIKAIRICNTITSMSRSLKHLLLPGLKGENGKWEIDSGKLPPSHLAILVGKWEIVVKWKNGAKRTY